MLPDSQIRSSKMQVASQAMVPRDITDEFTQAASKLSTGQLVKDEYFTLFEAVGALEIMDSKMDSGYIAPGEDQVQALEDSYDVTRELSPEEAVGIMDQLLCHEMAWHMGHPLSQTLFTSIYLDKVLWPVPRTVEQACFDRDNKTGDKEDKPIVNLILRAYCLALVKACDFVHARVIAEYFYEEEDFVTQLYNRSLLSEFDAEHFRKLLDQAVSWIDGQEGKVDDNMREAIKTRLLFRRDFLAALEQDIDVMQTRSTEHFSSCLSHLSILGKSVSLGQPVSDAFSLKIQRKLASTVPPRPMVNISFDAALAHLRRLCQDAIDLQQALDYRGAYNFRVVVWTLMSRKPQPSVYIRSLLQSVIVHDMSVLGRVPVKQFLYDDLAELVLPSSILLQADTDAVEVPSDPRFQIAKQMHDFVKRFAQPFVDTLRSACLNRCRVRRTICHTVVDWDNLQIEAEELDVQLRTLSLEPPLALPDGQSTYSYPLSSWAYHQKLSQLRLILQLGFELSIYAPEELPGMYWYLSHICSTHLGHIDRIRTFTIASSKRTLAPSLPSKKPNPMGRQIAFQTSLHLLERLTTQLIAIDAFAIALHALYVLLVRHNLLPPASSKQAYSSERLRYELRLKPFIPISLPELVPFDEYRREAILEGDSDATVLDRATRAIAEARKAWEAILATGAFLPSRNGDAAAPTTAPTAIEEDWKRDVKDTMRACIGASIAIETVRKALTSHGPLEKAKSKGKAHSEQKREEAEGRSLHLRAEIPEVGSKARWHDWWIVPQVSQRAASSTT